MKSDIDFNVIIPVAEADLQQLIVGLDYIFENLQPRKIIIIANNNLKDFLPLSSRVEFLDEDNVFEKLTLHNIEQILEYLVGNQKRSGWYFQQFLKMAYAYICEDAYYLIWDADTVPLNKIEFRNDGKYYFTMKTEYHKPYFDTLEKLFSGEVKKHNQMSFISEQMIIDKKIMIEVIEKIKHNKNIKGKLFFEKILYYKDTNGALAFNRSRVNKDTGFVNSFGNIRGMNYYLGREVIIEEINTANKTFYSDGYWWPIEVIQREMTKLKIL